MGFHGNALTNFFKHEGSYEIYFFILFMAVVTASYDCCQIRLLSKTHDVLLHDGHKKIYRPQEIVSLCLQD